jgi:cephalosporin-C deacetylase-like acetyl esterase
MDGATEYVDTLIDDIKANLPTKQHRRAPDRYKIYGEDVHYASFKKNRRTTWYAFFTKYRDENNQIIYLIGYIGNNHTDAHHLFEDA